MKTLKTISKFLFAVILLSVLTKAGDCQTNTDEYVYLSVNGKILSRKLNVEVDFGDKPEQVIKGNAYSDSLSGKKSYIAVLNFMLRSGYELVETMEFTSTFQGTGGTSGIGIIMRKKKE
jgi:hypothetical protein